MSERDKLHDLVDELPERELVVAARVLEALRRSEQTPSYTTETAPDDEEPVTPEEQAAVDEAWEELRRGEAIPHAEAMRELGLD